VFLAMEYVQLGDLEKNLPISGRLPEMEVQQITKQILDGLHIMHTESFAHRDLKPQVCLSILLEFADTSFSRTFS
jgi:serine/threonine protein kinase